MLYLKRSFSVPASSGDSSICASVKQHCGPDAKGKCLRCGGRFEANPYRRPITWTETTPHHFRTEMLADG